MNKIIHVTPMENYTLLLEFKTGERRMYDMSSRLTGVFEFLKDYRHFSDVRLTRGAPTWLNPDDGMEVDLCPDALYMRSLPL